jgi:hypothetical protein
MNAADTKWLETMSQKHVVYHNDQEYRQCVRDVFNMSCHALVSVDAEAVDDVTQDEWNYDDAAISRGMDILYAVTREHPIFQELYQSAAATMISEAATIGLAVLCSYDYFHLFHDCLREFLQAPDTFCDTQFSVVMLKKKIK